MHSCKRKFYCFGSCFGNEPDKSSVEESWKIFLENSSIISTSSNSEISETTGETTGEHFKHSLLSNKYLC